MSEPSFCRNCGERLQDGDRFCTRCGQGAEPVLVEQLHPPGTDEGADALGVMRSSRGVRLDSPAVRRAVGIVLVAVVLLLGAYAKARLADPGDISLSLPRLALSKQDRVWRSFVDAVSEKRADDALALIDSERYVQRVAAEQGQGSYYNVDQADVLLEGFFRTTIGDGTLLSELPDKAPESIDTEGDFSTLLFDDDHVVYMERRDGQWRIVWMK